MASQVPSEGHASVSEAPPGGADGLRARSTERLRRQGPKPAWLKVPLPGGEAYARLKGLTAELGLHTVCEEARCPNIGECWKGEHATMTLMVLGDECTRRCRFCAVKTVMQAAPPDPDEPRHVGQSSAPTCAADSTPAWPGRWTPTRPEDPHRPRSWPTRWPPGERRAARGAGS